MIRSPYSQRGPVIAPVNLAVAKHVGILSVQQRVVGLALNELAQAVQTVRDVLPRDRLLLVLLEVV